MHAETAVLCSLSLLGLSRRAGRGLSEGRARGQCIIIMIVAITNTTSHVPLSSHHTTLIANSHYVSHFSLRTRHFSKHLDLQK